MDILQKMLLQKKVWYCIIAAELLLLVVAGFIYDKREKVEINYTQDDLVDDSDWGGGILYR